MVIRIALVFALVTLAGCVSGDIPERPDGAAGTGGAGQAGTSGAAGTGGSAGAAGTTGTAGTGSGVAGASGRGGVNGNAGAGAAAGVTGSGGTAGGACNSSGPLFQDSFDDVTVVEGKGWFIATSAGGQVTLDRATFLSAPASAKSALPILTTGTALGGAEMLKGFMQSPFPNRYEFAFDAKLSNECLGVGGKIRIGAIVETDYQLWLMIEAGSTTRFFLQEGVNGGYSVLASVPIAKEGWHHFEVRLDFTGTPAGSVAIDAGAREPFVPHPTAGVASGFQQITIFVGANGFGPATACAVNYDNVAFDAPTCWN